MEITEIRMTLHMEGRVRAYADVTFDNEFVVHGMAVISVEDKYFVSMPSKPDKKRPGKFLEIAHPVNKDFRAYVEEQVLSEYDSKLKSERRRM